MAVIPLGARAEKRRKPGDVLVQFLLIFYGRITRHLSPAESLLRQRLLLI